MQTITPITTDDFKAKTNIVIGKIEIDSDGSGTFIELPDVKTTSVTTNIQNVVSRLCSYSFTIICLNTDNKYSPFNGASEYYGKLKRGRKLKVYMGINKSDVDYHWQWQLWVIDEIKLSIKSGEDICTITGRNLMGLLLDYKLFYPNTFWGNTMYMSIVDGETEYNLPNNRTMGAWDIRGAFKISSIEPDEISQPMDIHFNATGTRMYILDNNYRRVFQYDLLTAFSISTAIYSGEYFYTGAEDSEPVGLFFNPDGTKMYIAGASNQEIYQYDLGVAWDVTSAVYNTKHIDVSTEAMNPRDMAFSSDGTKMYVISLTPDYVFQYTLGVAWDVSTASYASKSLNVGTEEGSPTSIFFNNDGSEMYILGGADTVFKYTLETPWDLSTAAYSTLYKSLKDDGTSITGLFFKSDGTKMYVVDSYQDIVIEYTLDDSSIDVATGVYQASVDDIDPRDGSDEEDFSLVIEGTDFVYNKWDNTITFGTGGGVAS